MKIRVIKNLTLGHLEMWFWRNLWYIFSITARKNCKRKSSSKKKLKSLKNQEKSFYIVDLEIFICVKKWKFYLVAQFLEEYKNINRPFALLFCSCSFFYVCPIVIIPGWLTDKTGLKRACIFRCVWRSKVKCLYKNTIHFCNNLFVCLYEFTTSVWKCWLKALSTKYF
jgi:hypothetical protein